MVAFLVIAERLIATIAKAPPYIAIMMYSSKTLNVTALVIATALAAIIGSWLFRQGKPQELHERPAMCHELDLSLDLRNDGRLSMQSQEDRDQRCNRVMRGIPR